MRAASSADIVRLNVGGVRFYTTRGTLLAAPASPASSQPQRSPMEGGSGSGSKISAAQGSDTENFFTALLSGRVPLVKVRP